MLSLKHWAQARDAAPLRACQSQTTMEERLHTRLQRTLREEMARLRADLGLAPAPVDQPAAAAAVAPVFAAPKHAAAVHELEGPPKRPRLDTPPRPAALVVPAAAPPLLGPAAAPAPTAAPNAPLDLRGAERYLEYDKYLLWCDADYAAAVSRALVPDEFVYYAQLLREHTTRPGRAALLADGLPRARYYCALARLFLPDSEARQHLFVCAAGVAHWLLKGEHERFLAPLEQHWAAHAVTPPRADGEVRLSLLPAQSWTGCRRNAAGSLPPYFPVGAYHAVVRPARWPPGLAVRALSMHALVALLVVCPEAVGILQLDPARLPPLPAGLSAPERFRAEETRNVPHPYVCDSYGRLVVPPRQATDAAHEMRIAHVKEGAKRLFFSRHYPKAPLNWGVRAYDREPFPLLWGARYQRTVEGLRERPRREKSRSLQGIHHDLPPAQRLHALRWLATRRDPTLVNFVVDAMRGLQPRLRAAAAATGVDAPEGRSAAPEAASEAHALLQELELSGGGGGEDE